MTPTVNSVAFLNRSRSPTAEYISTKIATSTARGTRLGRVRIAADAANPPPSADHGVDIAARRIASNHQAVTGTSLMGSFNWYRNTGLVKSSAAPINPQAGPARRLPNRNATKMATPPSNGTARNAPNGPNSFNRPAMTSGRPDAYVGTIVAASGPGR